MTPLHCLILAALLTACTPSTNPVDDYVQRLESVLDVSGQASEISAPVFPKPRDLKIEFEASELSIREFLSLRQCKLHTTIAERNSAMGKVANQSQTLFNDIRILAQGPACLEALDNAVLVKKLRVFLAKKTTELDKSMWQGLLAQTEHAKFWSVVNPEPNETTSAALTALAKFVNAVQSGHYNFNDQEFDQIEQHLGALRFANSGLVLQRNVRLINAMRRANSAIEQRLARPLCLNNKPTTKATHLQRVVTKYFISNVQRNAVDLNRLSNTLMEQYRDLEAPLIAAATPSYQDWAKQRDAVLMLGASATTNHAKLLQKLYRQCGLKVGKARNTTSEN